MVQFFGIQYSLRIVGNLMGTGNIVRTDLYALHSYVQNTMISYPKELFIENLREFFSKDSYFHYSRDPWGFPNTPDHTDMDPAAGLRDDVATRIFIGEANRFDSINYPALLIRNGGSRSVPISMSRDKGSVQYSPIKFIDGYGNEKIFNTPSHFIQAGAWEGQVTVEVQSRGPRSRDELVDLVSIAFVDTMFDDMKNSGVVIKPGGVNAGGPSESDDRNDKLFKQIITFDIRSEWRRHIPVTTVVDIINFCVDFGNLSTKPVVLAPNLKVSTTVELLDALANL